MVFSLRHGSLVSFSSVKHELLSNNVTTLYCKSVHCISLDSSLWRRMGDKASITNRSESVSIRDLFGEFDV